MKGGERRGPSPPQALPDDVTDVDDTVAERTLIVHGERTVVDTAARPMPMVHGEAETLVEEKPAEVSDELDDLRDAALAAVQWTTQFARWLQARVFVPGWRRVAHGWRRLMQALRWKRLEDSDAYSRRRGQQWQRFREGDPNINELREFDKNFRDEPPDRR